MRYTVFCGSSSGTTDIFREEAFRLGEVLAKKGIGVVYGGAKVGLMGEVANGAIKQKGEVIGVLPHFLDKIELRHEEISQLILVDSMHERKTKMYELSNGVVVLPGGYGTLEEFFEVLTWGQLGLHHKPVAIFNVNGFYNALLALFEEMVGKGFLRKENLEMVIVDDDLERLLEKMQNYQPPLVGKWL